MHMYKKFADKIYNILETKYGTSNKDKEFLLFNINVTVSIVILLVLIVLAIFTSSLSLVYYISIIILVIFQIISLFLLFKKHFNISVWVTIVSITMLLWFSIFYNYDYGNHDAFQIFYIVLGIFIFSILLTRKATLLFMFIQFLALILFVIFNPEISDEQNLPALLAFIIAAYIIIDLYTRVYSKQIDKISLQKEELILREQQLFYLSHHDQLTGLLNRRGFEDEYKKVIDDKKTVLFFMADIDGFKNVNDKFGHLVGDEVLKRFVEVINLDIDSYGRLSRWGGDEFIGFIHGDKDESIGFIRSLLDKVEKNEYLKDKGISVSIGYTFTKASADLDIILRKVDEAMYEAKEHGGKDIVFKK